MTDRSDAHRRQKAKNYAVLLGLAVFMAVIFAVTIVRMGRLP